MVRKFHDRQSMSHVPPLLVLVLKFVIADLVKKRLAGNPENLGSFGFVATRFTQGLADHIYLHLLNGIRQSKSTAAIR